MKSDKPPLIIRAFFKKSKLNIAAPCGQKRALCLSPLKNGRARNELARSFFNGEDQLFFRSKGILLKLFSDCMNIFSRSAESIEDICRKRRKHSAAMNGSAEGVLLSKPARRKSGRRQKP